MSNEVSWLIDTVTAGVVKIIASEQLISAAEALKAFCSSRTYNSLSDCKTGLYLLGSSYVYELYLQDNELTKW